jgi:hypothetical protein
MFGGGAGYRFDGLLFEDELKNTISNYNPASFISLSSQYFYLPIPTTLILR